MFGTPAFGLLTDKIGKRALLMTAGALLLIPAFPLMAYSNVSLYLPMSMMGLAFSLVPAIIWPSVAYIVDQKTLGTAYGLMTMIQNMGMASFNWILGWANDRSGAGPDNPAGYHLMLQILTGLGVLALIFGLLLRQRETGPRGHGLETITTASSAATA